MHKRFSDPRTAEVVVGADVTMTQQQGVITLHVPTPRGREIIGSYRNAAMAWAALDELDAPLHSDSVTRVA